MKVLNKQTQTRKSIQLVPHRPRQGEEPLAHLWSPWAGAKKKGMPMKSISEPESYR